MEVDILLESFSNLIDFIIKASPILITAHIVFAIAMILVGFSLATTNKSSSKGKHIGSIVCFVLGSLGATFALINAIFIYMMSSLN